MLFFLDKFLQVDAAICDAVQNVAQVLFLKHKQCQLELCLLCLIFIGKIMLNAFIFVVYSLLPWQLGFDFTKIIAFKSCKITIAHAAMD